MNKIIFKRKFIIICCNFNILRYEHFVIGRLNHEKRSLNYFITIFEFSTNTILLVLLIHIFTMQLWRVEEKFYTRWRSIIILPCAKTGPRKLLKTQGTFAIKFIFNKESCRNKFKDLKSYIYSQRINSRLIHV